MSVVAVIELGADDRLILRSRYEPTLVDALKQAIPYAFRSWDAAAKVWRIGLLSPA